LRNSGSTVISNIAVTKSGAGSPHFLLTAPTTTSLAPGQTTTFSAVFSPSSAGEKNALLSIASSDTDNSPFIVNTSGLGLDANADTDSDGLNDAAEFSMSALGFDWQSNQEALVTTLYNNANLAQLFTLSQFNGNRAAGRQDVISDPATYDLFTASSIMDLNLGGLMLQKQGDSVTLNLEIQKTDDLGTTPFTPFENISLPVTMPGNKGFLRVRAISNPN
jgi:hypothetical protein